MNRPGFFQRTKNLLIGRPLSHTDHGLFHKLSLVAFFAWVGLGADGLSSSCYGPEETYLALARYPHLSIYVALASALTVLVISASYSQIIELFPTGGGGYLVASKLLAPAVGAVSGCALLVDYVLTISISIASGADALFSFLPSHMQGWKLLFECASILVLTLLNMRGVKESVLPWVPIFLVFVLTHAFIIGYAIVTHASGMPELASESVHETRQAFHQLGSLGLLFVMLRAYSMGAGTYTGIEAVSNGLPILREPRIATGKRTMIYMAVSLAATVAGLMFAYLLYRVQRTPDKTLNAVLFERITSGWPGLWGHGFVLVTLVSETALLFIAAQAGFLDGPRVLANMALDRWFPSKFSNLSDRFVTQNGILLMGAAALITLIGTHGAVALLVVLYSINVFITFSLSQLGMVRHWWKSRHELKTWRKKIFVNGIGLVMTSGILLSLTIIKFAEGGWITLLVTGGLIVAAFSIKRHYENTGSLMKRLDSIVDAVAVSPSTLPPGTSPPALDSKGKTAVFLVNGFNGIGLHTVLNVQRIFSGVFKNFLFVQVGVLDAGTFKGVSELERLKEHLQKSSDRYVRFIRESGHHAEAINVIGTDVVEEVTSLIPEVLKRFPQPVFFGGQLVFPQESFWSKWLHNYIVFALQRKFYHQGLPFLVMPIRAM